MIGRSRRGHRQSESRRIRSLGRRIGDTLTHVRRLRHRRSAGVRRRSTRGCAAHLRDLGRAADYRRRRADRRRHDRDTRRPDRRRWCRCPTSRRRDGDRRHRPPGVSGTDRHGERRRVGCSTARAAGQFPNARRCRALQAQRDSATGARGREGAAARCAGAVAARGDGSDVGPGDPEFRALQRAERARERRGRCRRAADWFRCGSAQGTPDRAVAGRVARGAWRWWSRRRVPGLAARNDCVRQAELPRRATPAAGRAALRANEVGCRATHLRSVARRHSAGAGALRAGCVRGPAFPRDPARARAWRRNSIWIR